MASRKWKGRSLKLSKFMNCESRVFLRGSFTGILRLHRVLARLERQMDIFLLLQSDPMQILLIES